MNRPAYRLNLSRGAIAMLLTFVALSMAVLLIGFKDYPGHHTVCDTGMFLLSGLLALLFWELGVRSNQQFPRYIAISFAVTSVAEFVHAFVSIEWSGSLSPIAQAADVLRPTTWPPAAHLLPIAVGLSVWLMRRGAQRTVTFTAVLVALVIGLFPAFRWLPAYTTPTWLGITRPALILVPIFWSIVGWACWRFRAADRLLPILGAMAAVLVSTSIAMLYSRSPHDAQAMVAHLGRIGGYLLVLLSVMQMASSDMIERIKAERELARLNEDLERRVLERTAELQSANDSLGAEIAVRQEAEGALRESHERTRAIVDTALDGIVTMDHDGRIAGFNPAAERIFGYSRRDVIGRPLAETLIPAAFREQHHRGLAHYLATGEARVLGKRIEIAGLRADGSTVDVELSIDRMPGERPPLFAGFIRDITERKLAEAKVKAHLERLDLLHQITRAIGGRQDLKSIYQVVLHTLEDNLSLDFGCICDYDSVSQQLKIVHVGIHSQQLALKLALTEQVEVPIDANGLSRCIGGQLVYEPDTAEVRIPFPQRLAGAGLRSLVVAPLVVESRVFGVLVAARREENSFSSGECEFLRQVSEHVALAAHQAQLNAALQRAYDDLRETQQAVMQQERLRALGQMASGIAHDINNAISPIALYTESLLEDEPGLSPRARRYLETTQHAITDVAQTVSRMREFYRQREPELAVLPVKLNSLVQQVVELTRARWHDMPQQRGVMIEMNTELASDLPIVAGVESEIREALINLIFNAIDAMPEGGKLAIRTKVVNGDAPASEGEPSLTQVHLEVVDTGIGMDEEIQKRCLEPFFTTKGERGTGLGLAMVYGVVHRHSAELEIESAPGKGTTMRLSFFASAPVIAPTGPSTTLKTLPRRLRILIVDDDPVLLKSLCDTLETDGHVVTKANGGQTAIEAFRSAHTNRNNSDEIFDIVITDLGMPYVDGSRVCAAIKALSPSTPVILLTGWGQRLVAEGDVPPHIDRVLNKPPKLRALRETLAYFCGSARSAVF